MTISAVQRAAALIERLEHDARTNVGVETYVPLLSRLLETIESAREDRDQFVALLLRLVQEWPWGAIEILEFTMSTLRWPEIRAALEDKAANDPDFRHRRLAQYALAAFEDDWADGDIYGLPPALKSSDDGQTVDCTITERSVAAAVAASLARELEEDHVELWSLPWHLSRLLLHPDDNDSMFRTARVVLEVLLADGAVLGDYVDGTGEIAPWPSSGEEPVDRVMREWRALERHPNMGDIGWLTLPPGVPAVLDEPVARESAVVRLALSSAQQLVATIEHDAQAYVGVSEYETTLIDLLTLLESVTELRAQFVEILQTLVADWPWGAVEILEFTMHTLRWPEIRTALEDSAVSDPDFRLRALAERALEAFDDEWEDGEIYVYYRPDDSLSRSLRLRALGRAIRSFLSRR